MAKLALPCLLLVLVLFTSGMQICIKAEQICQRSLGICRLQDSECDTQCKSNFTGHNPSGDCAISPVPGVPPLCTCYFDCAAANAPKAAPPKPKRCTIGLGLCSSKKCGEECCNARCGARYVDGHAQGYCFGPEPFNACHCDYDCGANVTPPTTKSNSLILNANWIVPIVPIFGSYFLY